MVFTIFVGIDFGTTFSGVAWAHSKKPQQIEVITRWQSEYSCADLGKTPTHLQKGTIDDTTKWGYSIPPEKDVLRWFKLLLLDEADVQQEIAQSSYFKKAIKDQKSSKKTAVELVACYLRLLWHHSLSRIKRALGPDEVDRCKLHFVITTPAMWPHYVQSRMKNAAELAGLFEPRAPGRPTLDFVSEPEAAAQAVVIEMQPRPNISVGDTMVVCDAGGGTADLISYQVDRVEPFELRECVSGEGGLCGGIFVDNSFEEFIIGRVGDAWKSVNSADRQKFMKENWENGIKPQFANNKRSFVAQVPFGYLPNSQLGRVKKTQELELTNNDLLSIFSPTIDKICQMVHRQTEAITRQGLPPPKFIILVGGFGDCTYLFDKIAKAYPNSTVLNPPGGRSWTACMRGAVRHGMARKKGGKPAEVTVRARIARRSYGFTVHDAWDASVHHIDDKFWNEIEGQWMANNQMEYFVTEGQALEDMSYTTHNYYHSVPVGDSLVLEEPIFYCEGVKKPTRKTADVHKLCTLKWNKGVALDKLPLKYNNHSQGYYLLEYTTKVTIDGPNLNIEVFHNKMKVANDQIRIEFQ